MILLTACCSVAHAWTTLAMFDAGRLKDQGLPSFDNSVGKGTPADTCTPHKTQGSPIARKFQLGETLPV